MIGKVFANLTDLESQQTAHKIGLKKVFLTSSDTDTALTQFSYGELAPGEAVESHVHPTMEELYYFEHGEGLFKVGDELINVRAGSFIRVPHGVSHDLSNKSGITLRFVYFGVATK